MIETLECNSVLLDIASASHGFLGKALLKYANISGSIDMPTMSSTVRVRGTTLQKKYPHDSINRQRSNGHTLKTHCTVKLVEQQSCQHSEPNDFDVSSQTALTAHSSGSPSLCEAYMPILFFPSKQSLSSKTAALRMGLSHAKISKSHGIALLRLTLFFSCILLVLCLHSEQLMAKGQFVSDCKSTPSLRNGTVYAPDQYELMRPSDGTCLPRHAFASFLCTSDSFVCTGACSIVSNFC